MSKRELGWISQGAGVDVDAPRAKRHKTATSSPVAETVPRQASEEIKIEDEEDEGGSGAVESPEEVKEKGLKLWQVVKDAVNKDGRVLSTEFIRLPSKRQYGDYYNLIKRPVSFDTVKQQLDLGSFASFLSVKQDLEQIFKNAKIYNQRDSQIWLDAKLLHKTTKKEYLKMIGSSEKDGVDGEAPNGDLGDEDGDKKRAKVPNLGRQLKAKLQKLVDKTDDSGRVIATEFMELPSKKQWPHYYTAIKRPQCFENIFKKVKRKEYTSSAMFAEEVELVFSNALDFNEEHTQIWEDAVTLRKYFAKLMSELPEQFSLPQYVPPPKIKVPRPAPAVSARAQQLGSNEASSSTMTLRLPAQQPQPNGVPAPAQVVQPVVTPAQPTVIASTPSLPVMPNHTAAPLASASASTPVRYQAPGYGPFSASTPHQAPPVPAAVPLSTPSVTPVVQQQNKSESPVPPSIPHRALQSVIVTTMPAGRILQMDHSHGVKSWALKLGARERSLTVSNITFAPAEDADASDIEAMAEDEDMMVDDDQEEEDEPETPRRKGKGKRGHNRFSKQTTRTKEHDPKIVVKVKVKNGVKIPVKKAATPELEDLVVRLNGTTLHSDQGDGVWQIDVPEGNHVLEMGEKEGKIWKLYVFS